MQPANAVRTRWRSLPALALLSWVLLPAGAASAEAGALTLGTDATGPLFTAGRLAPGALPEACLTVTYAGATPADALGVSVQVGGSGLADYLQVVLEAGTGGRYGDCSGFSGSEVFAGTLAALAREHASINDALIVTSGLARPSGAVTFRLRVTLAGGNAAQGLDATAAFTWTGFGYAPAPSPSVAVPSDPPTAAPTPEPSTAAPVPTPTPSASTSPSPRAPAPTASPTPTATASPSPSVSEPAPGPSSEPTGQAATDPAPPSGSAGSDRPSGAGVAVVAPQPTVLPAAPAPSKAPSSAPLPGGSSVTVPLTPTADEPEPSLAAKSLTAVADGARRAAAAVGKVAAQAMAVAAEAAAPAAKGTAFGVGTLPLVAGFLLVQRRLEARDPKLALAPTYAEPDLSFEPRETDA